MSKHPIPERSFVKVLRRAASALRSGRRGQKDADSESMSWNQAILDSLVLPVAVVNSQGKVIGMNRCWTAQTQTAFLDASSLAMGTDYFDVCRSASSAGSRAAADALKGIMSVCSGSMPLYELQYSRMSADGERWFSMTVTPLLSQAGGAVIIHRDMSNLKQAEVRLRDSDERFTLIVDNVPAMIWMAAADGRCIYLNKQWLDFTGRHLNQELGNGWADGIHPEDRNRYLAAYEEAFAKRQSFKLEYRLRSADGGWRWVLNTGVPLLRGNGEFVGFIGTCIDISDRLATEEKLIDLGGRLIDAQEEERSRIARELHDNLSQKMALLSTEIEQLAQLVSTSVPETSAALRELLIRVQDVSSEMHRMSYELHPSKLDRLGLAAASMSLCKELSKQQSLHVECSFKNIPDSLPRDISLCLYRVIQESLQNVIRHSGASNATVELYGSRSEIRLRITDEGVGFNPESVGKEGGLGLLSMRERLRLVGGTIAIESQPLHGARIDVTVPLVAARHESGRNIEGVENRDYNPRSAHEKSGAASGTAKGSPLQL